MLVFWGLIFQKVSNSKSSKSFRHRSQLVNEFRVFRILFVVYTERIRPGIKKEKFKDVVCCSCCCWILSICHAKTGMYHCRIVEISPEAPVAEHNIFVRSWSIINLFQITADLWNRSLDKLIKLNYVQMELNHIMLMLIFS